MRLSYFAKYAWGVLIYNLFVILWGAYVRATGSGAGCGSHWPLCNGDVIPRAPEIETMIEFAHRVTSGVSLILVVIMLIWSLRIYPKGHPVRLGTVLSMVFIITEALIGAGLVLFEWVAQDDSIARAISMAIHLVNTFLLLAAITLTAWWASGGEFVRLRGHGIVVVLGLAIALLGVIILGVSGALTALGDTLFPATSLSEGIKQDFSTTAHFLVRLRLIHPVIATVVGFYIILLSVIIIPQGSSLWSKRFSRLLIILFVIQLIAGLINVYLLAPVWLQIIHLLLADLVWIVLVLFANTSLAGGNQEVVMAS